MARARSTLCACRRPNPPTSGQWRTTLFVFGLVDDVVDSLLCAHNLLCVRVRNFNLCRWGMRRGEEQKGEKRKEFAMERVAISLVLAALHCSHFTKPLTCSLRSASRISSLLRIHPLTHTQTHTYTHIDDSLCSPLYIHTHAHIDYWLCSCVSLPSSMDDNAGQFLFFSRVPSSWHPIIFDASEPLLQNVLLLSHSLLLHVCTRLVALSLVIHSPHDMSVALPSQP